MTDTPTPGSTAQSSTNRGSTVSSAAPDRRPYWAGRVAADGTWRIDHRTGLGMAPAGQDLAAMRSGLGRPAGTVPALWPFYVSWTDGSASTVELEAEHAALSLFGLHQQGQNQPMHRPGVSLGAALRALRNSDRFSEEAVDRRVAAAVNATSVSALLYRLRGLVTQLRSMKQPLDYDELLRNVKDWDHPEARQRVRRAWGLAYHSWSNAPGNEPAGNRPH